jgi:hypothetical protein
MGQIYKQRALHYTHICQCFLYTFTPFEIVYGRRALLPIQIALAPPKGHLTSYADYYARLNAKLDMIHETVRNNLKENQAETKKRYDKKVKGHPFEPGHLVWLYYPHTKVGDPRKLTQKWVGPYEIIHHLQNGVNYRIRTLENKPITKIVHFNRLKLVHDQNRPPTTDDKAPSIPLTDDLQEQRLEVDDIPHHQLARDVKVGLPKNRPGKRKTLSERRKEVTEVTNDEKEVTTGDDKLYLVDKILNHRRRGKIRWFLVKWSPNNGVNLGNQNGTDI